MFALICLIGVCHLMANPVTVSQAREKASQFLNKRVAKRARAKAPSAKSLKMMAAGKNDSYYIFNVGEVGGYVVVSGDDATEEILGYSDTGSIDPETMPCNMRALLDTYAAQIQYLRDNGITREQNLAISTKSAKSYHITRSLARYDQGEPYNRQCPVLNGKHCATGCVATAMAQLMFYHKWPRSITCTIPGYTSETHHLQVDEIPSGTVIDWIPILPGYGEGWDDNEENIDAIANLMKMAGSSVHMDYGLAGVDGSGITYAPFITFAFKKYFGYESADVKYRNSYDYEEWMDLLHSELENNGPVIYMGTTPATKTKESGAHAFMLEGYDEDNYYDINFGWSGDNNNKFLLDAIVVDGETRYQTDQIAILNLIPQSVLTPTDVPVKLITKELRNTDTYLYYRSQSTGIFDNLKLWAMVINDTPIDSYFDYGFRLTSYDNLSPMSIAYVVDENMKMLSLGYNGNNGAPLPDNFQGKKGLEYSFSVGSDIRDGIYLVNGISKENGTNTWYTNDGDDMTHAIIFGDKMVFKINGKDRTVLNSEIIQTSPNALRKGIPAEFSYSIENLHSADTYDGYVWARLDWIEEGENKAMPILLDELQVLPNSKSNVVSFTFTPPVEGDQRIVFYNKCWEQIGSYIVNAVSADASLDLLEVTNLELVDGDIDRRLIDGTYLRARMSVKNKDVVTKKSNVTITLTNVETQVKKTKTITVNIEPNSTATYSFGFGNLTAGNHYTVTASYPTNEDFYTSPQLLCTTEGMGEVEPGNESLVQYEYWFDDDFANRQVVGMNSNSAVVRASIETDGLEYGAHRFNFRVKRSDNMYSAVTSSMFLKKPAAQNSKMEYWFDDNFDGRDHVDISSAEDEQTFELDLRDNEKYPWGFHKLNMRIILEGGGESAVYSSGVLKLSAGKATTLEYWLDGDRDNVQTISGCLASDGKDYLFVSDLNLGNVTPGHHRLYCRAVSNSGKTVSAVTMTPIIVKSRYNVSSAEGGVNPNVKVTHYSLSVDNEDPVKVKLSDPSNDITLEKNLDVQDLTPGKHTVKARFWNSLGLAVGDETQFTVTAPATPTIALTATEADGTVQLHFDVPTSVHRFALNRRDANGAKAVIYKETQNEIGGGLFTDSPSAGSYTYFVQGSYRDASGTSHLVSSDEIPVSVAQAQTPTEYGYITGIIWPKYGAATMHDIVYSDGVETTITDKYFERQQIPVGTELTISVRGNALEEFETATVTIKKGENSVSLKDITQVEETTPNLNNSDLQFGSDLEWVGNNYQFIVKNITRNAWSGQVRLRIITKEKALLEKQKEKEEGSGEVVIPEPTTQVGTGSVAPFQLRGEDNYVYVYSDNISLSKDQSAMVCLSLDNVFAPDKKDWYYIYVESVGKWDSDPKDMIKVKPIGIDRDFNITENPILRQVDKSLLAKAQEKVLLQDAEYAANIILACCSKLKQFNGIIGDIEQLSKEMAEKGQKMKDIDMAKLNRYIENAMETETAEEFANDEMVQSFLSAVYGNTTLLLVQKFREDIANDIFKFAGGVNKYLGGALKCLKYIRTYREWERMNDYDQFFTCADAILDCAEEYASIPACTAMCSILKTYSKVARSFIQKAIEYGETYYSYYGTDLLFENVPSEKDQSTYEYNRHVDFKIKVRTNRLVFFNFDHFGTSPIRDVVVKVHNKPSDPDAVASIYFDLVPVWDGVMLKQKSIDNGGGYIGQGYLDEGYPIDRMWMEIKWKNGRTTKIPLRNDIDGVEFEAASITQNTKQYTVYLQSGTTKFANMADIIEIKK